jgi:hypothetical protein
VLIKNLKRPHLNHLRERWHLKVRRSHLRRGVCKFEPDLVGESVCPWSAGDYGQLVAANLSILMRRRLQKPQSVRRFLRS